MTIDKIVMKMNIINLRSYTIYSRHYNAFVNLFDVSGKVNAN